MAHQALIGRFCCAGMAHQALTGRLSCVDMGQSHHPGVFLTLTTLATQVLT